MSEINHPDGLVLLRKSVAPGHCPVCECKLEQWKNGRWRTICRKKACRKVYIRLYLRDWRMRNPEYQRQYRRI